MAKEVKFYRCSHCGNIVEKIVDSGVPVICCGEPMKELIANTSDGAGEKHVPVVTVNGDTVKVAVGEVMHPMTAEHYIQFVYVQTERGGLRVDLNPNDTPVVEFKLTENDKLVAVYEYCNLHGLWKTAL